jgi:hypothetical protein
MNDDSGDQPRPARRLETRGETPPSGLALLAFFAALAVACLGGYLLLMKLIDMSRQEDCLLAHRRNCAVGIWENTRKVT